MQKKFVIAMIALCLCMCCLVGVTVAWLTSTTGEVKNIFTVGDVKITLDEAVVDVYGVDQGTRTTTGNTYKLIPVTPMSRILRSMSILLASLATCSLKL
jgi:cell division septal protein FtsQ